MWPAAVTTFHRIREVAVPALGAAVIVIAALVAARTANSRQARQLGAERERHRASLDAESERLSTQLAHEREIRAQDDLRAFFDGAAAVFEETREAAHAVWRESTHAPDAVGEDDPAGEDDPLDEAMRAASNALGMMLTTVRRMGLRLPLYHEVALAYAATEDVLSDRIDALIEAGS